MNQINQEPTIKDIFEIVEFIRDTAATKDDIADVRREIQEVRQEVQEVRQEVQNTKNEMIGHVDAFVGLYQKHEQELCAVVARIERFEEKLDAVIKHLNLKFA